MKQFSSIINVFICVFLLASCSPAQIDNPKQTPKAPTEVPTLTALPATATATVEQVTPTSSNTIAPTQTPTKTEVVPALNGTPMPGVANEINKNNAKDIKMLKSSSSNKQIEILGSDGSKWSVQKGTSKEIRDTKTNELIWKAKGSTYFVLDQNGTQALFFKNNFSEFEVQYQDKESETIKAPPIDPKVKYRILPVLEKKIIVVYPEIPWWYQLNGETINVFNWGEITPKYSLKGSIAEISKGKKYIAYQQGKNLVFTNIDSGEKVNEYNLGNPEFEVVKTGINKIWKTSWDDEYMAISRNGSVEIWKLADHKLIRTFQIQKDGSIDADNFMFSINNKVIMVLLPEGIVRTWSIESGEVLKEGKSTEESLLHLRVSDDGEIIKFNLPEVAGRSWNTQFNYNFSQLTFAKDTESLLFSLPTFKQYEESTEICVWDLAISPACDYWEDHIFASPGKYRLFSFGSDNEPYFLKTHAQPISLHQGWEEDGKLIAQIPQISRKGDIFNFKYDPVTGLIQMKDLGGKTFIFNHKTKSRLLVDGNLDRFLISIDGKSLYELVNQKKNPTVLEFVQYDSQTLKEISRIPLDKTIHPAVLDKSLQDLSPNLVSAVLSPDGKKLYAYIYYLSKTKKDEAHNAVFLTVSLDAAENSSISEMELKTYQVANMLITGSGDLAIISQTDTGDLHFIDTTTGKIVHTLHVGGNPVKLAMKPDGKLIAVADVKDGIQLLGIPGD
jgi:WD40 repeat protein